MEPFLRSMAECCATLDKNRTPNVMMRAFSRDLPSEEPPDGRVGDYVRIERHGNSELLPRQWMVIGLAFAY